MKKIEPINKLKIKERIESNKKEEDHINMVIEALNSAIEREYYHKKELERIRIEIPFPGKKETNYMKIVACGVVDLFNSPKYNIDDTWNISYDLEGKNLVFYVC